MRINLLLMCLMGWVALYFVGAESVKPAKAPTSLPITLTIQKPAKAPTAGMQGTFPMTLEVKNNSETPVKIADYVPVDPIIANLKTLEMALKSDTAMLRVTCKIPDNAGGLQLSREHIGFKDVTLEPRKTATLKFEVPGVFFSWPGKYQLQAEILNKDDFTCAPSAAVVIEVEAK
jgi:hypothetical protein